jgi:hypothetical protein
MVVYLVAILIVFVVLGYIGELVIFGWKSVPQGHIGFYLAAGVPIEIVDVNSGSRLVYKFFKRAASLIFWEKEVAILIDLASPSKAKILTASSKSAVYDNKDPKSQERDDRFTGLLHNNRVQITKNKVVVVLRLKDVLTFYKEKRSMEEARERLTEMAETARRNAFNKKTYDMIEGTEENIRLRMEMVIEEELAKWDKCFELKTVWMPENDFSVLSEREFKLNVLTPLTV